MKKLISIVMIMLGSRIVYTSESSYPPSFKLLQLSYSVAKSRLERYERSLEGSDTSLSSEKRESLERVMIYRSEDLVALHDSVKSILDLQKSLQLSQTKKFQESGISEQEYVDKKIQNFRTDIVLCEKQLQLLDKISKQNKE